MEPRGAARGRGRPRGRFTEPSFLAPLARRLTQRGQGGFTLVESLVAVVLVGLVVLALAGGMVTLLATTAASANEQRLQTGLTSFTESVKAMPYRDCASLDEVRTDYAAWSGRWDPPSGMTVTITDVEYWNPAAGSEAGEFQPTCPGGGTTDRGAQRLSVHVTWNGDTATTETVVRKP